MIHKQLVNDENQEQTEGIVVRWYHWGILISLDMIGPFSQDAYIPNIPTMEKDLNASHFEMNLTLQSNWILKAVASLAIGYISDKVGRKPTLFTSLFLYILATVACSMCTNSW